MILGSRLASFLYENRSFLAAGFLISLWSSFGQTFFISLFAADIMHAFALTDGGWGLVYATATICAALVMVWAGGLTDRYRIRVIVAAICLGLALACLSMALAQTVVFLAITVFALRFFGQGMMSHLAFVAMARWFTRSRGRALAIAVMGFAFGTAVLPALVVAANELLSWRWLWVISAGLCVAIIPVLLRLLRAERTPQALAKEDAIAGLDGRHWTRAEMLRTPIFWSLVPLMIGPPAFGTALFFHQVHLTETKGWALLDYVALMPLFTLASVGSTVLSGLLLDRFGSTRLMMVYLLPFAAGFYLMSEAQTLGMAAAALVVFGLGSGAQGTVPVACWAELFGTRYLGSIKALSTATMVLGSALGPGITGVIIDRGTVFEDQLAPISLFLIAACILAIAGLRNALPRLPRAA